MVRPGDAPDRRRVVDRYYLAASRLAAEGGIPRDAGSDEAWRAILSGSAPGLRRWRRLYGRVPSAPRCRLCNVPFNGTGGAIFRSVGKGPWPRNPTMCRMCVSWLEHRVGGAEVVITVLFADIRGSTAMAEQMTPTAFSLLLSDFYRSVSPILYDSGAVVDKFLGDEVMALFVPGFAGDEHALVAVEVSRALLDVAGELELPVGIGVHTGLTFVGSLGDEHGYHEFTAVGDTVNVAARLATMAGPSEAWVTTEVDAAGAALGSADAHEVAISGRIEPVTIVRLVSRQGNRD